MNIRKILNRYLFLCTFLLLCNRHGWTQSPASLAQVEFHSSNAQLNETFLWAKGQALAYVRPGADVIGPWYEAALPGRNAFCMRDVSHQAEGAAVLGLFAANRNMLSRFAESSAASRKWAAFWEIDGMGMPSVADYRSDSDFWFTLPANFDVLDAMVRMWRWTGEDRYRDDPRLQLFYRETLTGYIQQWQLDPAVILTRQRIANRPHTKGEFNASRGIPSYTEDSEDFILGTDLLAAEYRAIRSYAEIAVLARDKDLSKRLRKSADKIQNILETTAWSQTEGHFNGLIRKDRSGFGSGDTLALYFNAIQNPSHVQGALDYVSNPSYWTKINIEAESYLPEVLFRYGRPSAGQVLFDLAAPNKLRREYPEVSYTIVAAIICGAMGIEPAHAGESIDVQTLPQPLMHTDALSVSSLRIKNNLLEISNEGSVRARLFNREGPALRWRAEFEGTVERLRVNGRLVRAHHVSSAGGTHLSSTIVTVQPGQYAVVSVERIAE